MPDDLLRVRKPAILIIVISIIGAGAIIWALGWETEKSGRALQYLVIIAGISGATTAVAAGGLRLNSTMTNASATSLFWIILLSLPLGSIAGAGALLVTVTILSFRAEGVTQSGSAILGGIYGLLLGGYWATAAESSALRRALLTPAGTSPEVPTAPKRTNWKGIVTAELRPKSGDRVSAELIVQFEAEVAESRKRLGLRKKRDALEPPTTPASSKAIATARGDLIVEGGEESDYAEFVVTVSGGEGYETFPRRQLARAPISGTSERYPFTLVAERDPEREKAEEVSPTKVSTTVRNDITQTNIGAVLIDIAMAGRTIQVLEVSP
ncbi:hypothetical protein [Microlunatus aurantiacus]|uniref:hypothetical protein n=1 Tax=Microlunatus aurantiacus TaxID=446786 RepID=UPI0031D88A88